MYKFCTQIANVKVTAFQYDKYFNTHKKNTLCDSYTQNESF